MAAVWRIRNQTHDFSHHGWIMGVLNVTPDSFSDGGQFGDAGRAIEHGLQMAAEGADILDIGGESTRPGADPVPLEEELRRVIPVIRRLREQTNVLISIDTMKPEVAQAALEEGADIINDITGMSDPRMAEVAARSGAGVIVMHMQGTPRTMQQAPHYDDVVAEVRAFFEKQIQSLTEVGIVPEQIALDPGIGFGKTLEHNLNLLRSLSALRISDHPFVVGVSRKSSLGRLIGDDRMESRAWPTVALTSWLRENGAEIFRVHDVKPNAEALHMTEAILGAGVPAG
jgi:dihydropteroate synthase